MSERSERVAPGERRPDGDDVDGGTTDESFAPIARLLARPDVWDEPPDDLIDVITARIATEAAERDAADPVPPATGRTTTAAPARGRRTVLLVAAAAAVLAIAAGVVVRGFGSDGEQQAGGEAIVALAGTDLAPAASARAEVSSTPVGLKIVLDCEGLDPAPDGAYYEAWVRSASSGGEDGVSAGTFHLRNGLGEIELWAGVDDPDYRILTVTVQDIGGGPASSGRVVLRGEIGARDTSWAED